MRWILAFTLASAIVVAEGQERFRFYTTEDGLPQDSVLAMLQSKDGYLWFTTYRGLVRFDGVQFKVFDQSNTPAIQSTIFVAFNLMEDRDGAIWAGVWSGGAIRYHKGKFTSFGMKDGLADKTVKRIDQDAAGNIWFYTPRGLSRQGANGNLEKVSTIDGEDTTRYLDRPATVGWDGDLFGLWRTGRGTTGLQRFARGKWTDIPLPPGVGDPAKLQIEVTLEDSLGRLWYRILGRPGGESFCVEADGQLTTYRGLPAGSFANYRDRSGRLWITDAQGNTALWRDGVSTPVPGFSTPTPIRVLEDRDGEIWAGTLNQGLIHAPRDTIRGIRLTGGVEANTIRPLLRARNGDIWIGSYGLTRMHNGSIQTYMLPPSMAKWSGDQIVWSLWEDGDGSIYFSNVYGPKVFRNGRIEPAEAPLNQIHTRVNAILRDRSGALWMGGETGIHKYRDSKLALLKSDRGLPFSGEVRAIAEDKSGTVWIGTDAVLCNYKDDVLTCGAVSNTSSPSRIRSLTVDADGVLWVSTAFDGILRIEGSKQFWIQAKDGLPANDTAGILEDADGYFWIGSRVGIFRVKKQELNDLAYGRTKRITASHFGRRDGLNAADTAGFGQPKGFVDSDGALWFPTADGLATIDPRQLGSNAAPAPPEIESCILDQVRIPCDGRISLQPGARNLEISFTSPTLLRSSQMQFRYRMVGLDPDWVDARTRRTAYYPYLPPGNFKFQIMAANSFGVWSQSLQEISINVQPHFYQTNWFAALITLAVLGLFGLLWRIRALRFEEQQALQHAFSQQVMDSQESERKRIASELHDSLGQRLTLIKNMALLLTQRSFTHPIEDKARHQQIGDIAAETTQAIAELRQISRNLRPSRLDILGLTKSVEALVQETCAAASIQSEVVLDDMNGLLPKNAEIHFYRIVQECLNNTVKHAQASTVTVIAQATSAGVSLIVSDDGTGFHPERVLETGFGLTGIAERAQLLGGKASFQSTPGQGTVVTIEIQMNPVEQSFNQQEHEAGACQMKSAL
jgi:signal transduction histidine kinase/ligand-binding sensor domain-containing protein